MEGVGGLAGWRWIFILEGLLTVLCGLFAAVMLPNDIASAEFLSIEEKEYARVLLAFSKARGIE